MKSSHILTLTLTPLLLIGCSSGQDAPPPPPPPQKTVFDSMTQTEQRARDVQKTVDENTAQTRKATEAQERGDAAP